MKPKTLALLCVAVGCGLVAMVGVQQAMNKPAQADTEMVQVLEALDSIDPGVFLSPENVAFKEVPLEAAPDDSVTSLDQYKDRSLIVAVVKGDYIVKSKLSEPGVSGKSTQIPVGKTVATINVDETNTASNMVKPGDIVDVCVTYDARTATRTEIKTITLLECVKVFAIADQTKNDVLRRSDNTTVKARQVSLIVTNEEGNALFLAERKGTLRLLWRNPKDTTRHNTPAMTESMLSELRGVDPASDYGNQPPVADPVKATIVQQPAQPDLHQFLATSHPTPTPDPMVVVAEPPVQPQWEVKVFVGNDVQSYPFAMPAEDAEHKDSEAKASSTSAAGRLLKQLGWSLPWADKASAVEQPAVPQTQAL